MGWVNSLMGRKPGTGGGGGEGVGMRDNVMSRVSGVWCLEQRTYLVAACLADSLSGGVVHLGLAHCEGECVLGGGLGECCVGEVTCEVWRGGRGDV